MTGGADDGASEYRAARERLGGVRVAMPATPWEVLALVHGVLTRVRVADGGDGTGHGTAGRMAAPAADGEGDCDDDGGDDGRDGRESRENNGGEYNGGGQRREATVRGDGSGGDGDGGDGAGGDGGRGDDGGDGGENDGGESDGGGGDGGEGDDGRGDGGDDGRGDGGATTEPEDLLAALTLLRHLREELASWEPELIAAARDQSVSWASLAPALGVTSRQAAERRYLRLQPSATGEVTGEDRVRAERTRRAGERAVAAWAREHSGVLRRLAGQISAIEGLPSPAQQRVDIVHRALAGDDPAGLLGPLADAHADLEATHSGLAEQVRSVTEQTERLRRDTEAQRAGTQ